MAFVVNDRNNLPVTIISSDFEKFEKAGMTGEFFKALLAGKDNPVGIERDNYYIINTDVMISAARDLFANQIMLLGRILNACNLCNIKMIMIKKSNNV